MEAVTDFTFEQKMRNYSVNHIFIHMYLFNYILFIKCIHTNSKNSHPVCTSESLMSSDTNVKSLAYFRNIYTLNQ